MTEMEMRCTSAATAAAKKAGLPLDYMSDPLMFLPVAQAVIRAMREPTKEMRQCPLLMIPYGGHGMPSQPSPEASYRAMIDAASPPEGT